MDQVDKHDRDKLLKWEKEIRIELAKPFPLHSVFLVTERDFAAHKAFRLFRDWMGRFDAPFSSLVIFGQHGSSDTMAELVKAFGLSLQSMPYMILYKNYSDDAVACYSANTVDVHFFEETKTKVPSALDCTYDSVTTLNTERSIIGLNGKTVMGIISDVIESGRCDDKTHSEN